MRRRSGVGAPPRACRVGRAMTLGRAVQYIYIHALSCFSGVIGFRTEIGESAVRGKAEPGSFVTISSIKIFFSLQYRVLASRRYTWRG